MPWTRFSPVHNVHEHDWIDPRTGKPAWFRMKIVNLFAPADDDSTILTLLVLPSLYRIFHRQEDLRKSEVDREI